MDFLKRSIETMRRLVSVKDSAASSMEPFLQSYPLPAAFPPGDIRRTRAFLIESDTPAKHGDPASPRDLFASIDAARDVVLLVAGSTPDGLLQTPAIRQMADLYESAVSVEFLVPTAETAAFQAAASMQGNVGQLIPMVPEDQLLPRIDKLDSDQLLVIIPQGCGLGASMAHAVRQVREGEADSLIGVPRKILLGDGIMLAVEERVSVSAPVGEVASIHSRTSAAGHIIRRRTLHEEAPMIDHVVTGRVAASMVERVTEAGAFKAFPFSGLIVISGYTLSERNSEALRAFADRLAVMGHEVVFVCPENKIRDEDVPVSLREFSIMTTAEKTETLDPPIFSFLAPSGSKKPTIVFDWPHIEPELARLESADLVKILAFATFMTQAESRCTLAIGSSVPDGNRDFRFLCLRHDRQIGAGDFTGMDERGSVLDRL